MRERITKWKRWCLTGANRSHRWATYTYSVDENDWSWSDGMYLMHGYEPREVPATTEVLLLHKHPDDRSRAAGVLDAAVQDGHPFSCYHRIIDRHEHIRNVLSVGRGIEDPTGTSHASRVTSST